jgi:hypothetical protein
LDRGPTELIAASGVRQGIHCHDEPDPAPASRASAAPSEPPSRIAPLEVMALSIYLLSEQ